MARRAPPQPRAFGKTTSLWTLELVTRVSFEQGLTPQLVFDESMRCALKRLGTNWKRAKHWITSPDPQYLLKKRTGSIDHLRQFAAWLGNGLSR